MKVFLVFALLSLLNCFELTSKDIISGEEINDKYTPYGKDLSPSFEWSDLPKGTKSLAFSVEDPDAPIGLFYHWIVINIPVSTKSIEEGKKPNGGIQIKNSWGIKNYKGPMPPANQIHHYHFVLYALNKESIPVRSYEDFANEIEKCLIEKKEIVGIFTSKE